MKYPVANKELGQHFLRDQKVIQAITQDFKDMAELIVEVGPGPGVLTQGLSKHELPFYVIEKDERFPEILKEHLPLENIFLEDALKFNWEHFLKKEDVQNKKIWLVSNLPYNISAPLLMQFMRIPEIKFMTLMFQKEVGEKTYYRQHEKNQMSSLLALGQTYFKTKMLCKVMPGAFSPPPKVDSVVVSYERRETPEIPFNEFIPYELFLRHIFSQKRKQLGSVLKSLMTQEQLAILWEKSQVLPTVRAEGLSLAEVQKLFLCYRGLI